MQTIKSKLGLALLIIILLSAVAQATLVRQSDLRIGISTGELEGLMGQPSRVDPTPFEYEWWIYNQDYNNYFQVGVRDNEVVRIYSNSANWGYKEAQIGKRISEVENVLDLSDSIEFEYQNATITLEPQGNATDWIYMSIDREEAVDTVVQVIVDLHDDNRITAVLLSDIEANLATGNYAHRISWSGDRPEFGPRELSTREQRRVDQALEAQFLDLINSIRVRNELHPLSWYQPIAQVALEHSKDMYYNDFFAHQSPFTGSVGDRVRAADISFQRVLENISYGRNDAIKSHESLMNSLGHRKNILNPDIVELGAGAYQSHKYTQKFLLRDSKQLEERREDYKRKDNEKGPTDLYSNAEIRQLFEEGKRDVGGEDLILKWPEAEMPIEVNISGAKTREKVRIVDNILADLEASSPNLSFIRQEENTEFTIYFVPAADFPLYRESISEDTSGWQWAWYVNWRNYELSKADLFIASDKNLSLEQVDGFLRMNMLRALGLRNTESRSYSETDYNLLRMLYNNKLKSGSSLEDLKEIF